MERHARKAVKITNRQKFGNKPQHGFDSRREERRYQELLLLEWAGKITDLKRQVKFELVPAQYEDGKCVERAVNYYADFVYTEGRQLVVEDVKSDITRKQKDYILKRKLMLWVHHIRIRET